ncbi:MAG: Flp pilus assembly protein CpaB [Candidatus Binataceae bacterium]
MKRSAAFMVLAGVAAILASFVVYSALQKREAEVQKAMAQTVEIAVAAQDLPLGAKIDAGSVRMARWSRDSLPAGSFTDPSPVINAFVKSSLVENEPLVATKLFMGEKTAGVLPLLIPPGMRAMSVAVDEVSDIAGFVLPHTRVDVLVAMSNSTGPFSKMVLQNVEVLAVAQEVEGKKDEPQVVKVVTLLVTPEEAERLALASREGSLRLAMRNYNDTKIVMTSGSDVVALLHSYSLLPVIAHQQSAITHATALRPRPQFEIEIMRDGKTRQSVSFTADAAIGPTSGSTHKPSVARSSAPAKAVASDSEPDGQDDAAPAAEPAASAAPINPPEVAAGVSPASERSAEAATPEAESSPTETAYVPKPKTIDVP